MVKINKSMLPKEIVIKKEKDYRSREVMAILQKDFYNKCYICEEKYPTSINVEHLRSCANFEHLKYNWENLFYACAHCNKIKKNQYDDIIDCTKEDPEKYLCISFNSYPEQNVLVSDRLYSAENVETRELLDKVYNGAGTTISKFEADNLKYRISMELKKFTECLNNYLAERDTKLKAVYRDEIEEMLRRESNFAGFKRSIIMESEELMEDFGELLN